jgi:acyl-coenzyme A thioesterase PaaI-like protein
VTRIGEAGLAAARQSSGVDVEGVADLSRLMIDRLVSTQAPSEVLDRVAQKLRDATAELDAHVPATPRNMYEGFDVADYLELFRLNPVIGRMNPLAPRFELEVARDGPGLRGTEVIVRTTLGLIYEGPMGMVHGGIIASLFDQFLSIANIENGFGAFTGTLVVRYRAPCPLDTPLTFRCRTDRTEGRKVFACGELYFADALAVEAEGTFVQPSTERLAEIVDDRARVDGRTTPPV